jgi:hypothetical protein
VGLKAEIMRAVEVVVVPVVGGETEPLGGAMKFWRRAEEEGRRMGTVCSAAK